MKRVSITQENAYGTALDRFTGVNRLTQKPSENEVKPQPPSEMIKLSVFLNRQEDAYLETLASTAKFTGGKKISKTKLIQAMVRAFSTTDLDVRGIKTSEELLSRLNLQLRK